MKRWCLLEIDFPVSAVTQFEKGERKRRQTSLQDIPLIMMELSESQ